MERKKIERKLEEVMDDMAWTYKYWTQEDTLEFRNLGSHMTEEEIERLFHVFMDKLEEEGFRILIEGKTGVVLENDQYWLCRVSRRGGPDDKEKKIDKTELKDLFDKSLHRIDGSSLPSNRVLIKADNILDIYTEYVNKEIFLNLNVKGSKEITLRDDGGLHLEI